MLGMVAGFKKFRRQWLAGSRIQSNRHDSIVLIYLMIVSTVLEVQGRGLFAGKSSAASHVWRISVTQTAVELFSNQASSTLDSVDPIGHFWWKKSLGKSSKILGILMLKVRDMHQQYSLYPTHSSPTHRVFVSCSNSNHCANKIDVLLTDVMEHVDCRILKNDGEAITKVDMASLVLKTNTHTLVTWTEPPWVHCAHTQGEEQS